MYMTSGVKI